MGHEEEEEEEEKKTGGVHNIFRCSSVGCSAKTMRSTPEDIAVGTQRGTEESWWTRESCGSPPGYGRKFERSWSSSCESWYSFGANHLTRQCEFSQIGTLDKSNRGA